MMRHVKTSGDIFNNESTVEMIKCRSEQEQEDLLNFVREYGKPGEKSINGLSVSLFVNCVDVGGVLVNSTQVLELIDHLTKCVNYLEQM